jgi:hypothetical protein
LGRCWRLADTTTRAPDSSSMRSWDMAVRRS